MTWTRSVVGRGLAIILLVSTLILLASAEAAIKVAAHRSPRTSRDTTIAAAINGSPGHTLPIAVKTTANWSSAGDGQAWMARVISTSPGKTPGPRAAMVNGRANTANTRASINQRRLRA